MQYQNQLVYQVVERLVYVLKITETFTLTFQLEKYLATEVQPLIFFV